LSILCTRDTLTTVKVIHGHDSQMLSARQ